MPSARAASGGADHGMGGRVPGLLPSFQAKGTGLIRLQVGAFDPTKGQLPTPPGIGLINETILPAGVNQHWLTQVRDGRFSEVQAAVQAAGGKVVGNVPDATYMVRATPAQRAVIATSSAVRWMGLFQPAWKIPAAANGYPGLLELTGRQTYLVFGYRDDPTSSAIATALAARPSVKVIEDDHAVVAVEATAADVPFIAALPQVQWVTMPPTAVLQNANARWVIDTGERDVLAITKFLTGKGQVTAVADTALAYTKNSAGRAHEAFRDCNSKGVCKLADYVQATPGNTVDDLTEVVRNNAGSPHRKMVAYFDLGKTGVDGDDPSTHGTHVAGSVTGDAGVVGQPNGDDGMAPGARLVQQNINGPGGTLATPGGTILPFDYYELFRQAYRPSNPAGVPVGYDPADYANYNPLEDARTHNNSYGMTIPVVDLGQAAIIDQFVWEHEDMNIVIAAGNAGPAPATLGAPAVAKNILSSGATSNGRQPMVTFDSNTNFSSHGPTADGRFGVTVSDPGEIIVSTKGGTDNGYQYLQGTSMSSPILTGAATLVRQYFWDGFGPSGGTGFGRGKANLGDRWNPSSALVRASIVNGAVRMRGLYTGTDGTNRGDDGQWPSAGQGFGRLNLDNSLYLANDPVNNWYADVWRDDADAFSIAGTKSYTINVDPGSPLDVTLAYTDAPNLQPAGGPSTVNNLDLVVIGPGGVYSGNNMNSRLQGGVDVADTQVGLVPDPLNTVERVHLENPAAGTYTVQIIGQAIQDGPQGYALSASGRIHAPAPGAFVPGPPRLNDAAGKPKISDVAVEPVSADLAKLTFTTNEPTSASATIVSVAGGPHTYNDVYTLDGNGYYGVESGPVETSDRYAGKRVVGTRHEIYLSGLSPGTKYDVTLRADDLGGSAPATSTTSLTSPGGIFQPSGTDMAQLMSDNSGDQWVTGKQMYTGALDAATDAMGVFMFRIPASVDPSKITGAMVELTTAHDLTDHVKDDPLFSVGLLDDSVEPGWGTQTYQDIDAAPIRATALPETPLRRGGGNRLDFTFACNDLAALKQSLSGTSGGQRLAAFRTASTLHGVESVVSYEFGYNRRSRGAEFRPKLVLLTANDQSVPPLSRCDSKTPAPKITEVGVHPGATNGATVTWRTDVDSDSLVIFREKGAKDWIQAGSPARTKFHQVAIRGVDASKHYEFGVRSRACNGATTTADNNGAGWDLFRPLSPPRPTTAFYFHGPAGSATFNGTQPSGGGQTQTGNPFTAVPESPGDSDSMWWQGPLSGTLDGDMTINGYFSSAHPLAADAAVNVTVWADADPVAHTGTLIGSADAVYTPAGPTPSLTVITVPVKGAPTNNVLVQLSPAYIDTSPLLTIHYDSAATPSGFAVPIGPKPPDSFAGQPKVGPLVPVSAGAKKLNLAAVSTRTKPTAADLAAGTGRCGTKP